MQFLAIQLEQPASLFIYVNSSLHTFPQRNSLEFPSPYNFLGQQWKYAPKNFVSSEKFPHLKLS